MSKTPKAWKYLPYPLENYNLIKLQTAGRLHVADMESLHIFTFRCFLIEINLYVYLMASYATSNTFIYSAMIAFRCVVNNDPGVDN